MYAGKSYKLSEFIIWTRKSIYRLVILAIIPVLLYQTLGIKWLGIPWTVVALLGTATAFIVGFKNTQTYNRTTEAQQIWTAIVNSSRAWGIMCKDFIKNPQQSKELIYRHLAWLTALRYEMRAYRVWESTDKKHNTEYQQYYSIPEKEGSLEGELSRYLSEHELAFLLSKRNMTSQLLALQSKAITEIFAEDGLIVLTYMEMQRGIKEFYIQQGRSEQLKDSPYPRQYAIMNVLLVRLFCFLLPYGMLKELDKLNESVEGIMRGHMVWLVIPFSVIISWMYTSLGQVGESTENPFEGNANDVPISQLSQIIEIDLREMMGETDLPALKMPENNIIM